MKYAGTDTSLAVNYKDDVSAMRTEFDEIYKSRFGFNAPSKPLVAETASVEAVGTTYDVQQQVLKIYKFCKF